MKYVFLSHDPEVLAARQNAFWPEDEVVTVDNWQEELDACEGAELVIVDMIATLREKGKIAGYEEFAEAKMAHPIAVKTPLILIAPPDDYEMDGMVGYPDFVFAQIRRPVTYKTLRRMTTLV
ncbi:MAG: hypothetical protein ABUL72_03860 [Armatimonadota bacterium]